MRICMHRQDVHGTNSKSEGTIFQVQPSSMNFYYNLQQNRAPDALLWHSCLIIFFLQVVMIRVAADQEKGGCESFAWDG